MLSSLSLSPEKCTETSIRCANFALRSTAFLLKVKPDQQISLHFSVSLRNRGEINIGKTLFQGMTGGMVFATID